MSSDSELLRTFATEHSEAAFAELVGRHVNLVYAVALRRTFGNRTLAEDATQMVFTDLARKARALSNHEVVAAWLYKSARFAAAHLMRTEQRRKAHEEKALAMQDPVSPQTEDPDWPRLRRELDDVLDTLGEADRQAVILRFYAALPFGEIGSALRLNEDAARRRVDRALEKLRTLLARRGVTSTAAALSAALTSNAAMVAPATLGATIGASAMTGAALGAGGLAASGVFAFMNTAKITAITTSLIAAAMVGITVHNARNARQSEDALTVARTEIAALQQRVSSTEQELNQTSARAVAAERDSEQLLVAIQNTLTAPAGTNAPAPIHTASTVQARYTKAQELARNGQHAEALEEFLWCYDEGMVSVRSMSGVRNSFLLGAIGRLAATHPPAKEALRTRRDAVERAMRSDPTDGNSAMDFAALNDVLGENYKTLDFIKTLPESDLRRETMADRVLRELGDQRRYTEAAQLISYGSVLRRFEAYKARTIEGGSITRDRAELARQSLVRTSSRSIELLAGAGDLEKARDLIARVLAVDRSETTLAILREHLERAGQSQLLAAP